MGLLNPIWLWGLTGLLVPVAIHLLSRKDMRIIKIGSLRHLELGTTRQAIRIRLNAFVLLALRCLIVALLAIFLAGLSLRDSGKATRWLVIENGLEQTVEWKSLTDSLSNQGYELRRLEQGFPLLDASSDRNSIPDYWMLSQQLSRILLDRCVVISRDRMAGFSGKRVAFDSSITWMSTSSDSSRFVIALNRSVPDSSMARVGRSNDMSTVYETIKMPSSQESSILQMWNKQSVTDSLAAITTGTVQGSDAPGKLNNSSQNNGNIPNTIRVVISGTSVSPEERRIVEAAIDAINSNGIISIQSLYTQPNTQLHGDWLIWLSADEPPANSVVNVIRKSLGEQSSTSVRPLLDRGWITRPLTLSNALREQFTLQLASLLLKNNSDRLNHIARDYDQRTMPESFRFTSGSASQEDLPTRTHQIESGGLLAIIIAFLFACERFVANRQQL
ncbi:MAG: BatA domain-containing protein [Chryseolinea sp.]